MKHDWLFSAGSDFHVSKYSVNKTSPGVYDH